MENIFNAKEQVIFIEPTWVTGETCLFTITDPYEYQYAKSKVTKLRKNFISRLESEGFEITYDKNDDRDVIYFIMNDCAISADIDSIDLYKKEFDKIIFEAGGEKLNYPYSLTMEEYFKNPFFPAVLKNELTNGGVDKFLIESEEQLEKIKKFYNKFCVKKKYKEVFDCSIFQQYIETPTNYKTYMRVLMAASGDVMGASLKFSQPSVKSCEANGLLEHHFWDENSEYYLNAKSMFNYYSNGENIFFPQPKYSDIKKSILLSHGIDPNNPVIPEDVLEVSSNIARKCNKELGIMSGIDFILNERDNKWYYLEIQAFPAIEEWANKKGIRKIEGKGVNGYIKYLELELEARYEALRLCLDRKLSCENRENIPKVLSKN